MVVLGVVFGGTAFGALVEGTTIGIGITFGLIYAILLAIGFHHLRAETRDIDCSDGECRLPDDADREPKVVGHTSPAHDRRTCGLKTPA